MKRLPYWSVANSMINPRPTTSCVCAQAAKMRGYEQQLREKRREGICQSRTLRVRFELALLSRKSSSQAARGEPLVPPSPRLELLLLLLVLLVLLVLLCCE